MRHIEAGAHTFDCLKPGARVSTAPHLVVDGVDGESQTVTALRADADQPHAAVAQLRCRGAVLGASCAERPRERTIGGLAQDDALPLAESGPRPPVGENDLHGRPERSIPAQIRRLIDVARGELAEVRLHAVKPAHARAARKRNRNRAHGAQRTLADPRRGHPDPEPPEIGRATDRSAAEQIVQ